MAIAQVKGGFGGDLSSAEPLRKLISVALLSESLPTDLRWDRTAPIAHAESQRVEIFREVTTLLGEPTGLTTRDDQNRVLAALGISGSRSTSIKVNTAACRPWLVFRFSGTWVPTVSWYGPY